MNHPTVSFVIPVYNQKKYVGKCIRSILNQSFKDIELILVNDGSTDGSLLICQKYAQKDQRIRIVNIPNRGKIEARKEGVLHAHGEYVSFVDNDDYLEKNAIEMLICLAQKYDLDMAIGNYDRVFDNWGFVSEKKTKYEKTYGEKAYKLIGNEEFTEQVLRLDLTKGMGVETLIWGRIYRRNCIIAALKNDENHLFPPDKFAVNEDAIFNLAITPYIHSCMIINDVIYHYRWGGSTSAFFPYVSKGGLYFDFRYEMCQKYNRLDLLPYAYCHYKKMLVIEIQRRIHFNVGTMEEIRAFIETELSERKIAQWAIKYKSTTIASEMEDVINNAIKKESAMKKSYWKMKLLNAYMKVADVFSY